MIDGLSRSASWVNGEEVELEKIKSKQKLSAKVGGWESLGGIGSGTRLSLANRGLPTTPPSAERTMEYISNSA